MKNNKNGSKGDIIMQDLVSYIKNLQEQNKMQNDEIAETIIDKKNVLKLFNYLRWGDFMSWVKQKLQQSGQDLIIDQKDQKERQQQLSSQRTPKSDNIYVEGQTNHKKATSNDVSPQKQKSSQKKGSGSSRINAEEEEQQASSEVQDALSQIVQQPDQQQSLRQNATQDNQNSNTLYDSIRIVQSVHLKSPTLANKRLQQSNKFEQQSQLLAIQNAKLRKQLIRLKDYVIKLQGRFCNGVTIK